MPRLRVPTCRRWIPLVVAAALALAPVSGCGSTATALATQNKKSDLLSFAILAVGADGYQAAVSYSEISPNFANKDVLVAVNEDGKPLSRPRLVVPSDVKGGRYVHDLIGLHVSRLTPA